MKKVVAVILVLLVASNVYFAYEVLQMKSANNKNVVEEVVKFETDFTKVVDEVSDKVVSVINGKNLIQIGSGSGVIYKVDGDRVLIITNHHVIEGGDRVEVSFSSGEVVKATVIGSDPYSDLALIEVKSKGHTPFNFGDSSEIKVGEFVLAIGSPLGVEFANSTTFGIISGKERTLSVDIDGDKVTDWDMKVIQTDAAINPGNSGGALINMRGELIGINSLKISQNQVEGMGFAIPMNEVLPIIEQIEDVGSVKYPVVGITSISIQDLSDYNKTQYNVPEGAKGILVLEVMEKSPAEKAGLLKNDIITAFDGKNVDSFKEFRTLLYGKRKGDSVVFKVLRDKESLNVTVVLD